MDDCLCSVSSVQEGVKIVTQLPQLLQKGGFHLTKWSLNNSSVLQAVPGPERSTLLLNLDLDNSIERVLGIRWNIQRDVFEFRVNIPPHSLTRRGILSTLSSLFDPLGFVSPIILNPKNLLQNLCKQGLNWDDDISDTEAVQWQAWLQTLTQLQKFTVSRCYKPADFDRIISYELHHFSDASANAYGACTYLRVVDDHGRIQCSLIMAKSRLAPMKTVSIPRLELTAAVLSVRLDILLQKELQITACTSTFWSDSTAVLHIIHNSRKRFPVFVANRVSIIERHTDVSDWKYIPSKANPADITTRPITMEAFLNSKTWLNGPKFLLLSQDNWPEPPPLLLDLPSDLSPLSSPSTAKVLATVSKSKPCPIETLINRYSSLDRLKKCVAWLI